MDVDVIEDAVDPLSQSLSVARLELRLRPGNESTDSPLETKTNTWKQSLQLQTFTTPELDML